jgi:hypothetical protein
MKFSEREAKRNGKKFTVVALWDDGPVAEAWYDRKSRSWSCTKCSGDGECDHIRQARSWLFARRKQQKEAAARTESVDSLFPRKKFAPCPD